MDNKIIAQIFEEIGDILEIRGESFFRVNAYRKAAITIENFPHDLRSIVENSPEQLEKIPGIGKALAQKIKELVITGKCNEHEELKRNFPPGLLEMLKIRTLGPKKIQLFYGILGIKTLAQLKEAAEKHLLRDLPRMGPKSEAEILQALKEFNQFESKRILINEALQEAERFIDYLKKSPLVDEVKYAGSLRRWQETIGDIDILATVKKEGGNRAKIMKYFTKYDEILNVIAEGDTKSSAILKSGVQTDLRIVEKGSFGAALHYFTGDKAHNIRIRDLAKKKGWKVNEYGIFAGDKMLGGEKENDVFELLGLPFIIPELRKDDGEIEYGLKNKKFPNFVELNDIRGDLHTHSKYSDGKNTIEEMAEKFISLGYEYFAVSDHSSLVGVTKGMGTNDIKKQWLEIGKLNQKYSEKIRILKSCEVDILKDGRLDFDDRILKELDLVIASAHLYTRLNTEEQTKRILKAVENPYVTILAHPTGRLINKRSPMEFDMEKIIKACVMNNVALEINSSPSRLDLPDKYVRIAKDMGAKFAINTDSHTIDHPDFIKYGIGLARRGWLSAKDVINTYELADLLKFKIPKFDNKL